MYRQRSTMIFKMVEAFCTPSPISNTTIFMVSRMKQLFVSCTTRGLPSQVLATRITMRTKAPDYLPVDQIPQVDGGRSDSDRGDNLRGFGLGDLRSFLCHRRVPGW